MNAAQNITLNLVAGILMSLIDCGWYGQVEAEALVDKFASKAARPRVMRAYVRSFLFEAINLAEFADIKAACSAALKTT